MYSSLALGIIIISQSDTVFLIWKFLICHFRYIIHPMYLLKRLIISGMLFDNRITQSLKRLFPTAFKIKGKCNQCGKCCEEILLKMTPSQIKNNFFRSLCIRWISWLYDFYLLHVDLKRGYLAFSCRHRGGDGLCRNYRFRPPLCRNYPLLDYFERPAFIKGCGYLS